MRRSRRDLDAKTVLLRGIIGSIFVEKAIDRPLLLRYFIRPVPIEKSGAGQDIIAHDQWSAPSDHERKDKVRIRG